MKTWKLVSGILSIIMFVFVTFQSCAAGISNSIEDNGEVGGSAGIIVAIMLLAGGNIAVIVLFGLGAIMGFTMAGSYTDLIIWAAWCAICAVLALISMIKKPKQIEEN